MSWGAPGCALLQERRIWGGEGTEKQMLKLVFGDVFSI